MRYYFVRADKLRATERETLPALQTLNDDPQYRGWVVPMEMNFDDACRGAYVADYCAVSHRWLTDGTKHPKRAPPDPEGVQLKALKQYLQRRTEIKYVWVDWLCMWQADKEGERELTSAERDEFKRMLAEVNLLYLGCKVLVLLDLSYVSRFWTSYEAWLGSQSPTGEGIRLADARSSRWEIVRILRANEFHVRALQDAVVKEMRTSAEAISYLGSPEIRVTNASDKTVQLERLAKLDERVRNLFARDQALAEVRSILHASKRACWPLEVCCAPRPLEEAVLEAERAGVGNAKLAEARAALAAQSQRRAQELREQEERLMRELEATRKDRLAAEQMSA